MVIQQDVAADADEPVGLVAVLVAVGALAADRVLHRPRREEPLPAREDRAADDAVDRARAERQVVPVDAARAALGDVMRRCDAAARRARGGGVAAASVWRRSFCSSTSFPGSPLGSLSPPISVNRSSVSLGDVAPRPQDADQRDVAEAADVALGEHAVLDLVVDEAAVPQAMVVAADERHVHLHAELRMEVVADEELGDEAVEALALVDRSRPSRRGRRSCSASPARRPDLETGPGLAHLGRGVDRRRRRRRAPAGRGRRRDRSATSTNDATTGPTPRRWAQRSGHASLGRETGRLP